MGSAYISKACENRAKMDLIPSSYYSSILTFTTVSDRRIREQIKLELELEPCLKIDLNFELFIELTDTI